MTPKSAKNSQPCEGDSVRRPRALLNNNYTLNTGSGNDGV
jgi:hypothetical protein